MFLSVFDMFKVGIGPSSSHTMGPMVAAARFLDLMRASPFVFHGLRASLHGSLAFTGVQGCRALSSLLGSLRQRLLAWGGAQLRALHRASAPRAPSSSTIKVQQRAAAIEDRGFLRQIFDTLPGVDTEGALEKIDAWKQRTLLEADAELHRMGNVRPAAEQES